MNQKNDRLLFIMLWIYNPTKNRPSVTDILEAFKDKGVEVSRRTIERDIQCLRSKYYIKYCEEKRGYDVVDNVDVNELSIFKKILEH